MYFNVIFLFVTTFFIVGCGKNQNGNCDMMTETDFTGFTVNDTTSSINGFITNYYPNGTTIKNEGNYSNGQPVGFWKFYYADGKAKGDGTIENGKMVGFWNIYFINGNIRSQGHIKSMQYDGFWKFYYEEENWKTKYEGHFEAGTKKGTWYHYNIDGEQIKIHECG